MMEEKTYTKIQIASTGGEYGEKLKQEIAEDAVELADALIEELNKREQ